MKFWIVLRDDDTRMKRHLSNVEALAEAKRLGLKEGRKFIILEATIMVEVSDVKVTEL